MAKVLGLSFFVLLNIFLARGQKYTSVIKTASGPIRGTISKSIENLDYAAFKGIPFAKPPTGYLRFKPPVKIDPWKEVYNATADGNVCIQFDSNAKKAVGSEDCLFINVYTPHTTFDKSISKPVMVWIYGGGYTNGESIQSIYGPDYILAKDVILVTLNYRLGAFGFLNLEHKNATGNCALKDQNLALKWVNENIAKFGGNSKKITLFGQSAGSVSVDLQVLSDMSTGLFSQSISMSGSTLDLFWGIQSREDALAKGFALGSKLGTTTQSKDVLLKTLYKASAADIVVATASVGALVFRPTLENLNVAKNEDKFLTTCSVTKYKNGNYAKGPHMMGFTSQEAKAVLTNLDILSLAYNIVLQPFKPKNITLLNDLLDTVNKGVKNLNHSQIEELVTKFTDLAFVLGIATKQKLISRNNGYPIYYYRFAFVPKSSTDSTTGLKITGAGHSSDIPYVFNVPWLNQSNQSDIVITRKRMVELYTNFAKYGNPTPPGKTDKILGITWPDSRTKGEQLNIDAKLTVRSRQTDDFTKQLQQLGLGDSPVLNECASK